MITMIISFVYQNITLKRLEETEDNQDMENHIVVLGSYENEFFLKQLWQGAMNVSDDYNAVVEFYVSESQAENVSLQSMFDYASFVNADGIIAYISSPVEAVNSVINIEDEEIPIVTTGAFAPYNQQISYVGTSYWELGQVYGEEISSILDGNGKVYILCSAPLSNPNFSNFTNSILSLLVRHPGISYEIVDQLSDDFIKQIDLFTKENKRRNN